MLMQGGLLVGGDGIDYQFNPGSFALTFGMLAVYFIFILKIGRKELKVMVDKVYK